MSYYFQNNLPMPKLLTEASVQRMFPNTTLTEAFLATYDIFPVTLVEQDFDYNLNYSIRDDRPQFDALRGKWYWYSQVRTKEGDSLLYGWIAKNSALFQEAFDAMDKKCARPSQDILARQIIATSMKAELQELDTWAEEENTEQGVQKVQKLQNEAAIAFNDTLHEYASETAADEEYLIGLRLVQEANRQRFTDLQKATTWEEAAAIVPITPI